MSIEGLNLFTGLSHISIEGLILFTGLSHMSIEGQTYLQVYLTCQLKG